MTSHNNWFGVDKEGLAKLIEKRGKAFALFELIQNAWDTDTTTVEVTLEKVPGKPQAKLVVVDEDPDGFHDLAHAYTLFAESEKKDDPTKRGRWNLGEKLVLALCKEATIASTKGTVVFSDDGTRKQTKVKRDRGSCFTATIKMNQQEYDEVCEEMHRLIPPAAVKTTFNGEELQAPDSVASFETTLQTVRADEEGNLTRTARKTKVNVHKADGEGWIYEMGIPVVETGDTFHVDVQQKVPVNMDRDNVPPSFLKTVRAHVLNETHDILTEDEAQEIWVNNALEHDDIEEEAVDSTLTKRFGEKRVVYDPSDREANNRAMAQGYTVIPARSFSREAWGNIRSSGAALPAGREMPTPKTYSDDENADPANIVAQDKWTEGMEEVVDLSEWLAKELLGVEYIEITIISELSLGWSACYGPRGDKGGRLDFNLARLGHRWFNNWKDDPRSVVRLLLHEFSHHYEMNHLSEDFADAGHNLGAKLAMLALDKPREFRRRFHRDVNL